MGLGAVRDRRNSAGITGRHYGTEEGGERVRVGARTCAAAEEGVERSRVGGHARSPEALGFGDGVDGESLSGLGDLKWGGICLVARSVVEHARGDDDTRDEICVRNSSVAFALLHRD